MILFQLAACFAYAQTFKVPLKNIQDAYGIESFLKRGSLNIDVSIYSGYDTLGYDVWTVQEIFFNNTQKLHEMGIDYTFYMKSDPTINARYVFDGVIPRNSIGAFVAIKDSVKYVIIDQNGNKNFNDDQIHAFHLHQQETIPEIEVEIDYYDGQRLKPVVIPFEIHAFVGKANLDVALLNRHYKRGVFEDQDGRWTITADNRHKFVYEDDIFLLSADTTGTKESINDRYIYNSKDSIPIGKNLYTVRSLTRDTLYLSYIAPYEKSHGAVNSVAPDIQAQELLTGAHFSLHKKRGEYVLMDFWGSWCAPCVDLLPDLVAVHNRFGAYGLQVVSIALDRKEDLNKLKRLIKEHRLDWEHLYVEKGGAERIPKDYKVRAYPTTLLIDPDGKVVLRGVGKEPLTEIERFLENVYKDQ